MTHPRISRRRLTGCAAFLALCALGSIHARPAAAQGIVSLADACAASDPGALTDWCQEVALAVQAVQGGAGMALAGGADLPGSASTLGRRMGRMPRISVHAGLTLARAGLPNVLDGDAAPAPESNFFLVAGRFGANAGVFDGFSLGSTVGGVLAVDLLGSYTVLGLPSDEGFEEGIGGLGYGAKIGLVRESFTLPGISLSWARKDFGGFGFGSSQGGDGARLDADLNVTSVRALVGKDMFSFSILGGYGWDTYRSDATIVARVPGSSISGTASARDIETHRNLWFVSGSLNSLLLQLTGEAGWASGFDRVFEDRPTGGYDPQSGSPFGSLAIRITL